MQERAARTRRVLVTAAAREFDLNGYAGSSLARITRSAGISMGALTFHFPNKEELAAVVRQEGHAATSAAVRQVLARREPPVQTVVSLTLALAALMEREDVVRAAARLSREQPGAAPDWTSAWLPVVRERLHAGRGAAEAVSGCTALTALAAHLVRGVESDLRAGAGRQGQPDGRPVAQLARIWELVLRGLAPRQTALQPPSTGTAPPVTNDA
ncbi:TetR/AcrR family transcriptional regulator [Streptomyces sp. NPDC089919]|uniref:TetR/AcrR family transcriptional regulator n=1 Tax=Streptomyces sp. NPDC089919 TaxID=3155188 RepID=UPI003448AFF0